MKIEIKCKLTQKVLFSHNCEDNTIKKTVERAVKENADLCNADLCNANMYNADLRNADLRYADLCNANLDNLKSISVSDHYLLSQILFNNAKTTKQREWAGLIRISIDWCWKDFLRNMSKPCIKWCVSVLSKYPEFAEMYEKERKGINE